MQEDLYCKVYVACDLNHDKLISLIGDLTNGEINIQTIESSPLIIDVMSNEDFDRALMGDQDGFVYFPYYLEIDSIDGESIDSQNYKSILNQLLRALRDHGAQTVPSCSYEDELNNV